jgi:hypothetical protein
MGGTPRDGDNVATIASAGASQRAGANRTKGESAMGNRDKQRKEPKKPKQPKKPTPPIQRG